MKRLSSMFFSAMMMASAFASTGCNKPVEQASQPDTAASAPANQSDTAAAKTDERVSVAAKAAVQIPAPPPVRVEDPGRAPSAQHRFQPGFWRYESPRTGYVWVPGHWERIGAAPMAPPPPRFEDPGFAPSATYAYVPGYWSFDGREFVWISGHWSLRSDVGRYYGSEYVFVNGRYERRFDRWDDARFAAHERAEREAREAHERAEREARERVEREVRERTEREIRDARERAERAAAQAKCEHGEHGQGKAFTPVKPFAGVASAAPAKTIAKPVVVTTKKPASRARG